MRSCASLQIFEGGGRDEPAFEQRASHTARLIASTISGGTMRAAHTPNHASICSKIAPSASGFD